MEEEEIRLMKPTSDEFNEFLRNVDIKKTNAQPSSKKKNESKEKDDPPFLFLGHKAKNGVIVAEFSFYDGSFTWTREELEEHLNSLNKDLFSMSEKFVKSDMIDKTKASIRQLKRAIQLWPK